MASNAPLMAGYLESWQDLSITAAALAGYTCVILAFGAITDTTVSVYEDSFPPDNGSDGKIDPTKLQEDIAGALGAGAKQVLLSFGGGANNTYKPGSADAQTLADNIVDFLKQYGFTGCDFDIEITTDGDYLQQLITAIKAGDSSLIVTAAPQLNEVDGSVELVTTGTSMDYNAALKALLFDYLFVQAYNTCSFSINGYTEECVEFISAASTYLTSIVPSATLISIGEPATQAAAGCSVYSDAPGDIYSEMASQYQSVIGNAQFGGAMTWSVNDDESNGYAFVKAIGPVV